MEEQERTKIANRISCYFKMRDIFNGFIIVVSLVVLCIDYEGQSR